MTHNSGPIHDSAPIPIDSEPNRGPGSFLHRPPDPIRSPDFGSGPESYRCGGADAKSAPRFTGDSAPRIQNQAPMQPAFDPDANLNQSPDFASPPSDVAAMGDVIHSPDGIRG